MKATTVLLISLMTWPLELAAATAPTTGWIGTYTSDAHHGSTGSTGIYAFQWDSHKGVLEGVRPAAATSNPAFLALHPNGRFLYAANEDSDPARPDSITAFAIDPAGSTALKALGSVSSQGRAACHISVDAGGKWLFAANYASGTIAVFPIHADGTLGEARQTIQQQGSGPVAGRQASAHAHEVVLSPDGHFLLAPDLGADRIFVYRFDSATGALTPNTPASVSFPPGYGPRHLVFSKDARKVYAVAELTPAIVTLSWDSRTGTLAQLAATATLPADFQGDKSAAEIVLHPSGKFLYASNRGDSNTIAIFRIGSDGLPVAQGSVPSGGRMPRFFGLDPSGSFLITANQASGDLFVYHIDPRTGALTLRGDRIAVPAPVAFVFAR